MRSAPVSASPTLARSFCLPVSFSRESALAIFSALPLGWSEKAAASTS
jgi:hypothetical protein